MTSAAPLLVVAGEGSGDAMAAPVVARLPAPSFGWGGQQLRAAGVATLEDVARLGVMGLPDAVTRAPYLALATRRLLREVRQRRPHAALLVGFSELNSWLGPRLRRLGLSVLWYAPPQIWAWRPGRVRRLARSCDQVALLLPFEEEIWRSAGAAATYVGHPATERSLPSRETARERLNAAADAPLIALLPGSRAQEVRRHLAPLLTAVTRLRDRRSNLDARVLLAPALDPSIADWVRQRARAAAVPVVAEAGWQVLPGFDAAVVASGTATLETALAGVPLAVVYRADPLTAWVARRLLRVPSVGLPNLVLEQPAFPELLQERLSAGRLARTITELLERGDHYRECCRQVQSTLATAPAEPPSARVAELLRPWLP